MIKWLYILLLDLNIRICKELLIDHIGTHKEKTYRPTSMFSRTVKEEDES